MFDQADFKFSVINRILALGKERKYDKQGRGS